MDKNTKEIVNLFKTAKRNLEISNAYIMQLPLVNPKTDKVTTAMENNKATIIAINMWLAEHSCLT